MPKYKKLDNLDDLRVGDVIIYGHPFSCEYEVLEVRERVVCTLNLTDSKAVCWFSREQLQRKEYQAKRPLPEKKVKRQLPKKNKKYFYPTFSSYSSSLVANDYWAGLPEEKILYDMGLIRYTYKEAQEIALKMIKAINPNYNG